ncbi:MAG TPA: peptidoglycan-binding protein [Candidatus Paceibacterota bacterium]|nr:peptidoglycan-binding protein [Candidatus Pacearchaeota archaeon]HRZ50684.1 peptidoglycan-binding protein [Candidatus Paceibacterota bacterium]HSA36419.1 peptidoglycan-binding protein [Candidatus Paceibacterota bacterium]
MNIGKAVIINLFAIYCVAALGLAPAGVLADNLGDVHNFNIDKTYDSKGRIKTSAHLAVETDRLYFYVDDAWWNGLNVTVQGNYNNAFEELGREFDDNIYLMLTDVFGSESNPAVDQDGKITILVHPMIKEAGGYFRAADGYSKYEIPVSNEREMIYLNSRRMLSANMKVYLAHEFTHLIGFNQKDIIRSVSEDDWLNEARADYSSAILGYDEPYRGSNLEQRVNYFIADPQDSVTEWLNEETDYASASLFIRYLVEQYGVNIIAETMKSGETGIQSINSYLKRNGYSEDFDQVFGNWLMAVAVNDCSYGSQYCYKDQYLSAIKVAPKINYLPTSAEATLSVLYNATYYAGNWQKIVGGKGNLNLDVFGDKNAKFSIRYFLCDIQGACSMKTLPLNAENRGNISLNNFDKEYSSLTLVPFVKGGSNGFNGKQPLISYSFAISMTGAGAEDIQPQDPNPGLAQLVARIDFLKKEIARLRSLLVAKKPLSQASCSKIAIDLSYGSSGPEVACLQELLKDQGSSIYPEGIVSGNFLALTESAVVRFQEKYASEILAPIGLRSGTGYVGPATRQTINRLLAG